MGLVVDGHSRRLTFRLLDRTAVIGGVDDWLWLLLHILLQRLRKGILDKLLHRRAILPAAGAHKDSRLNNINA